MLVKDVMTWNVVTVSSDTPILEAKKIMDAHHIRRLPVVDKGKLIGMISKERIDRAGPSEATSLSVWEINYLIAKVKVKEVMHKEVVTVTPETSTEAAVALAQSKGVGALPVVDGDKLVGILTTNDFFYRILNPMLGIGQPGIRLSISECTNAKCLKEIMECISKYNPKIISIHNMPAEKDKNADLCLHFDADNVDPIIKDLKAKGFKVSVRER